MVSQQRGVAKIRFLPRCWISQQRGVMKIRSLPSCWIECGPANRGVPSPCPQSPIFTRRIGLWGFHGFHGLHAPKSWLQPGTAAFEGAPNRQWERNPSDNKNMQRGACATLLSDNEPSWRDRALGNQALSPPLQIT